MQTLEIAIICIVFVVLTVALWRRARRRYWVAGHLEGQRVMKQRVREEVNQHIAERNISIKFRDGRDLSAEQLLDFMCHSKVPDPSDPTRGAAHYNPR